MKLNTSKSDLSKLANKAETVALTLSGMANAKRLLILCHLAGGEKPVTDIILGLDLPQSLVSQHLAKMRLLGLVKMRREGKQVNYSLANAAVATLIETLYSIYCAPPVTQKKARRTSSSGA